MYVAEEDLYIALFRNRSDIYLKPPSHILGNMVADIVLGYDVDDKVRVPVQLTEDQLKKYVGVYQFTESPGKRKISLIEGKIFYERPPMKSEDPWSRNHIIPMSVNEFYSNGKKSTITFHLDVNQEVTGMTVNQAFGRFVNLSKIE